MNQPEIKHYLSKFVHDTNSPIGRIQRASNWLEQNRDNPDTGRHIRMIKAINDSLDELKASIDYTYVGLMKIQNSEEYKEVINNQNK